MDRREIEKLAVQCLLDLEAGGVDVEVATDLRRISDVLSERDTGAGAALDERALLLTQKNVLWFFARREQKLLCAFGVRVDDLGGEDVQSFLTRATEVVFNVNVVGETSRIFEGRRWGRAAYFGGFTASTQRGLGGDTSWVFQLLSAYAHHCAFVDLQSDVNYSFHRAADVNRAIYYGFNRVDPFVWKTDRNMYEDGNPAWVNQRHKEDMPALLAQARQMFRFRLTKND